jgi:protein-tyrosine kinase
MALASSLAHDFDTNVTLVDADFQTHSIAQVYGLAGRHGLTDVLAGKAAVRAATHPLPGRTMAVVPAGTALADPARLARSGNLVRALEELKTFSSYVIVDLPATLHSMNGPALAQSCDAVVVVVRHGQTTRQELDRTLHLLKAANVVGVVVNRYHSSVPRWVATTLGLSS